MAVCKYPSTLCSRLSSACNVKNTLDTSLAYAWLSHKRIHLHSKEQFRVYIHLFASAKKSKTSTRAPRENPHTEEKEVYCTQKGTLENVLFVTEHCFLRVSVISTNTYKLKVALLSHIVIVQFHRTCQQLSAFR